METGNVKIVFFASKSYIKKRIYMSVMFVDNQSLAMSGLKVELLKQNTIIKIVKDMPNAIHKID